MDDDKRDDGRSGGDSDVTNVLARVLESRLRDAFAKFCADIPQLLRSMPMSASGTNDSDDAPEFVRALLEWIAGAPNRSEQACRYLLMWYAKSIADKGAHKLPDGAAVVELLRARLTRAELADVDLALRANWDALRYGGSLKTLASRQRKSFTATLTPQQQRRFRRYLALLPPLAIPAATPGHAHASSAGRGAETASLVGKLAIVAAMPLVAGLGWNAFRGRDAAARAAPPPVGAAHGDSTAAGSAGGAATIASTEAPEALLAAEDRESAAGRETRRSRLRWTRQVSPVTDVLSAVAWSGKRAVAVGAYGSVTWSDDGLDWHASPQPRSHYYIDVAYGNGRFVAVGTPKWGQRTGRLVGVSTDGERWTARPRNDLAPLTHVAFASGVFVAIGEHVVLRSSDGDEWEEVEMDTAERLAGVDAVGGELVIIDRKGTVFRSRDGLAWSATPTGGPAASLEMFDAIEDGDGCLLAGASHDDRYHGDIWRFGGERGTQPKRQTLDDVQDLLGIVHVPGTFVAVGDVIVESTDGDAWTITQRLPAEQGLDDVVWTGVRLIAVGAGGTIVTAEAPP